LVPFRLPWMLQMGDERCREWWEGLWPSISKTWPLRPPF
jgi:hypothetical protein